MTLTVAPKTDKLISWKYVAKLAGVSLSTAKRMVGEGKLPKSTKIGLRKVGFRQGEVVKALGRLTHQNGQAAPIKIATLKCGHVASGCFGEGTDASVEKRV